MLTANADKTTYQFDADKTLLNLSRDLLNPWTMDDAMKGISIIGGTGSGKTSASGKALALKFLEEGWGGLVLCAKADEAELWENYCIKAKRSNDYIIFKNGGVYEGETMVFNPIDYEAQREGEGAAETQNLSNIFMNIYRMGNRISGGSDTKEERYWDSALRRCLNRTLELLKLAKEDLSYKNMVRVLETADSANKPKLTQLLHQYEETEVEPDELLLESNYCQLCLFRAWVRNCYGQECPQEKFETIKLVESYFALAMPNMDPKTKSIVTESYMGLLDPFLYGLLYRHFTGKTTIKPEWTYKEGKIIILHFPIKEYLDVGIIAQSLFKQSFQQAIERRDTKKYPLPVFLWADEAHYFVNPYDQIFLTTARSSRTATVYLSQSISNYYAVMGAGKDAEARVDSLMGNLSTKIFHANSDAATNEYASRLIGEDIGTLASVDFAEDAYFGTREGKTKSLSSSMMPQVKPKDFITLKSGGKNHNFKVDSIIMATGRSWIEKGKKRNYIETTFTQNFNDEP